MNKQHKYLKFTSEAKNDNLFWLLDIKTTHHNQQLKTSVYRKPTFSGVFTHCESYLDQSFKKSLIDTLLLRCFLIRSDHILFHFEVGNLRKIFEKYSYPSIIIEQPIKSFLSKLYVRKKSNSNCC